jgi:hypothetical protein
MPLLCHGTHKALGLVLPSLVKGRVRTDLWSTNVKKWDSFPTLENAVYFTTAPPDSESGELIPGLDACAADLVFCSDLSACISPGDSPTPCPDGTAVKNSDGDELQEEGFFPDPEDCDSSTRALIVAPAN